MAQKVTSTDIKLALKEFHNGKPSYFITECKTCSTYFPDPQGLLKFDGLAITKSYTKPNIIGYEIKVSRNDFLQDNKWHLYLQYCNEFYFVVPKGLVKKELQAWKSVKKVLDKAGILPWRWWDNDSWVTDLEQRLNGKMDPMDLELAIKDTSRLLTRLQDMQVQEEQDDKS